MRRSPIENLIALAYSAYPLKPTVDTIEAWKISIGHLDHETVKSAIGQLIAQPGRKYPPTPGEITEVIEAPKREAARKAALEARMFQGGERKEDPEVARRNIERFKASRPDLAWLFNDN